MNGDVRTDLNVAQPDDLYEALIEAHRGLTAEQSASFNAALIVLLANHVGDLRVVQNAIERARTAIRNAPTATRNEHPAHEDIRR